MRLAAVMILMVSIPAAEKRRSRSASLCSSSAEASSANGTTRASGWPSGARDRRECGRSRS